MGSLMNIDADKIKKTIGRSVALYRLRARLTQQQLGEAIGVDAHAVSRMERGKTLPSLLRLYAIAGKLNVTVPALLVEQEEVTSGHLHDIDSKLEQIKTLLHK